MKYFRLFKAKKPISEMSMSERNAFSHDLVSDIMENIISPENHAIAVQVKDIEPASFKDTKEDFVRLCKTRETIKIVEHDILDRVFEKHANEYLKYLKSIKSIQENNLAEVSTHYLRLDWIDKAIHKRSMDLYDRLLSIKSALSKIGSWTADLEAAYKEASFGKSAYKPGVFVSCSVVIKQKDRFKLFDSAWNRDFYSLIKSEHYKESTESGSVLIWKSIMSGMIPDLNLVFSECSSWLK